MLTAVIISAICDSNSPDTMKSLRLVWPSAASNGRSARASGVGRVMTGCST
jgi:hypothetical protein